MTFCSDKYVSRAEYDELKIRVDRLEAMLSCTQHSAAPPCSESSPQQQHHQQQLSTRALGATTSTAGHRAQGPGSAPQVPYHPLSPPLLPGQAPAGHAGPSRAGATVQDYGAPMALRGASSPPGRTALPPLASLAHGAGPFDGPSTPGPSSRSGLHRDHAHHRHGEVVHHQPTYAAPPPPPPQQQQPLQPPHQQTKNFHAQTLTPLGERLRLPTTPQGPAAVVLRLLHHRKFFSSSSSSSNRRRRLLARAAQVRRCTAIEIMPAFRRHRRLFLVRQCNVKSGGNSAIPTHTRPRGTSSRMERGRRALCR
jgi:hypothetical protein